MKIESEPFLFNKNFNLLTLPLSDLQRQYLTYLESRDSIEQLVIRLLNNGWLVNFQELYDLVEKLVQNNAIINPTIQNYFKNIFVLKHSNSKAVTLTSSNDQNEKSLVQKLLELPFFRSLPKELSLTLIQKSSLHRYPAESVICHAGDTDRNMYVILSGLASIYKVNGHHRQFISVVSQNGIIGESSFLTGSKKSADIITAQACEILVVPYQPALLDPILNQSVAHQIVKRFWIQNALSSSDFFKKLPADCLDALTFVGKIITLQNEQILFKQNDPSHAAYLVVQGQIKIVQNAKIIASLPQGSFFGEVSLTMTNGIRTASAFSNGATTLLEIKRDDFYKLLSQNLVLAKEIQTLAFHHLNKDQQRN